MDLWLWSKEDSTSEGGGGGGGTDLISSTGKISVSSMGRQRRVEDMADPRKKEGEGSLFAAAISAFSSLRQEMEDKLVAEVLSAARNKMANYKAEKYDMLAPIL